MRDALSDALVRAADADERVIVLTGDHGYALFDAFRSRFPDRWINAGVAEQNMVGMAAGMAKAGLRPIVYGLSAFIPVRVLEQIKLDVAHDQLPVVFLGDGAGFVYSYLGTSHQCAEDIACARVVPHLNLYSPCDRFEMKDSMRLALESGQPSYIRIGKADLGDVHQEPFGISPGAMVQVRRGQMGEVTVIATGSMVPTALRVANTSFPEASVWSAPSLKPIDQELVVRICLESSAVVTMEEHSVFGGLGSIVAEIAGAHAPVPVLRVGVNDRFSERCGSYEYLLREHGLDDASVTRTMTQFLRERLGLAEHPID